MPWTITMIDMTGILMQSNTHATRTRFSTLACRFVYMHSLIVIIERVLGLALHCTCAALIGT